MRRNGRRVLGAREKLTLYDEMSEDVRRNRGGVLKVDIDVEKRELRLAPAIR